MPDEVLLTLKRHNRLFADPRRIRLLEKIQQTGSISQGARLAGISYKSAWDAINEMNQLAGSPLVEGITGGKGGGGSRVTRYGARLLQLYRLMHTIQQRAFAALQDEQLPLDSLLMAITRMSLQTSARNQLFATVTDCHEQAPLQHVDLLLQDGVTRIRAAITRQSHQRLGLQPGKEVLALIKAPAIRLYTSADPAAAIDSNGNLLVGTIIQLQAGQQNGEAAVQLTGGITLWLTLPTPMQQPAPQPGMTVYCYFPAEQVIIATILED